MTGQQSDAAAIVTAFLDDYDEHAHNAGDTIAVFAPHYLRRSTLRAVLAELGDARQHLAGLKTVWASIYSDGEYATKDEALAAASKDRFGASAVDEDVCWRLVGDWHDAAEAAPDV